MSAPKRNRPSLVPMPPTDRWFSGVVKRSTRGTGGPHHGVFCCLMGNSLKSAADKETYVFVANDPVYATVLHNRRQVSIKDTRSIAPFWHLILAIGPFPVTPEATACAKKWVNRTRGCSSKIRKGVELARDYGVRCYREEPPEGGTLAFLKRHAPRRYVKVYRALAKGR